jgi:hypothetical protein
MALSNRESLIRKAAARVELEMRKMRRDKAYFIENYCHIENKDIAEQMELFKLWDGQKKALQAFDDYRLNITLKARQMGLTWLALSYSNQQMIYQPGYTVVGLSKKEDDAKELVRRVKFQLENMPQWLIREHDPKRPFPITYSTTTLSIQLYHDGKETSRFIAMPAAKDSGRSFTANLVIIDEWAFQQWAHEIWTAAYPTINRPTGGKVIGISTGLRGTLFEEIWNGATTEENGFHATFLPWTTDPRRTKEWYEETKKALPRSYRQEYPTNPEDAFTAGEGAFFGEWDQAIHVKQHWYPPKSWTIVGAYDYGYSSRACYKWYALSPDGWARCYREYYPTKVRVSEQARAIAEMSKRQDGTPEEIDYTVADTQCWTPNGETGETIAETFANNGVPMIKADKEHHSGWARLHEWLAPYADEWGNQTALLTFTPNCPNTIRTYPSLIQDENNPEKLKEGQEDHCQDVDRYFVMSRPEPVNMNVVVGSTPLPNSGTGDNWVRKDDGTMVHKSEIRDQRKEETEDWARGWFN